jgi:hypothetical protein
MSNDAPYMHHLRDDCTKVVPVLSPQHLRGRTIPPGTDPLACTFERDRTPGVSSPIRVALALACLSWPSPASAQLLSLQGFPYGPFFPEGGFCSGECHRMMCRNGKRDTEEMTGYVTRTSADLGGCYIVTLTTQPRLLGISAPE